MRSAVLLLLALAPAAFAERPLGPNEGEVVAVYREQHELALRHGYIPELGMDPMSMVFVVAEPALLDGVKKGDRVRFKAGLVRGQFGIVEIKPLKPSRKEAR